MVLLLPYVLLLATKWSSSWSYNLLGSDVKEPFNIKSSFHHCSPIVGGKLKIIITVLTKVYFYSQSKCFYVTFLGVEVWGILVCLNYSMLLLNQCIMVIKKIYILRKLDSQKDPEKCWSKYFWLLFVIDAWKPYLILTYTPIIEAYRVTMPKAWVEGRPLIVQRQISIRTGEIVVDDATRHSKTGYAETWCYRSRCL